jgi:uncharacterized protein (UPF0548 family)
MRTTDAAPRLSERARTALEALQGKTFNYDLELAADVGPASGWNVDDYCQPLPSEEPGSPAPGGPFEAAVELATNYEFADPRIVRAVYDPNAPLENRDMLLEVRFYGLRFLFGCRVGGLVDAIRDVQGRRVRVWGWNYRTLQGHLEMGQMDYEVWKWLDNGDVEFRIHVLSRAARIPNPVIRLGFRLFGRRAQTKFARRACERMAKLTADAVIEEVFSATPQPRCGSGLSPPYRPRG